MPAQIRLPNPADDRPRAALVAASAVVGAALGVAAVLLAARGTSSDDHSEAHDDRRARQLVAPASAEPAAPPPAPGSGAPVDPPQAGTAAEPSPSAAAEAQPAPPQSADAAAAPPGASARATAPAPGAGASDTGAGPISRVTQVVPGRVAYVRCEGLSAHSGPYPCPRDRVLEAAVWDLLDTLHECRGAQPTADERGAELRLDFRGHAVVEASFRALAPEQRALEARLERCLLEPLSRIQTKLQPAHMVVSFRFLLL